MSLAMKAWGDLGIVETIFEDDTEELHSSLSSPPPSSPSSPLHSRLVDAWTAATGRSPNVKITVQGICFHLHKEPLISKSNYLKRQLIGVSEYTLSPPLKISSDTFTQIADFCYSGHAVITPSNVAALRTAAELLKMDCVDDEEGNSESLRQRTESYFGVVVTINRDFTCSVFRSCLSLLPEAEQKVFLASRCLEALFSMDEDDGENDGIVSCAEELKAVSPENFKVIADSMQERLTMSHDLLYRLVDLYFLVYNGKLSDEEKTQICSNIDCNILSSSLLMHAVQNPRMPLRFIVQSMLIEQLNTHRSIFSALNSTTTTKTQPQQSSESPATLGAILERDAALRQVAQLRAAIDTTSSKIQNLEMELSGMKKLLGADGTGDIVIREQGKSASCRFSTSNVSKVVRGERGSVSFGSGMRRENDSPLASSENDRNPTGGVVKRSLGQRLIRGLKVAFGGVSFAKKNEKLVQG